MSQKEIIKMQSLKQARDIFRILTNSKVTKILSYLSEVNEADVTSIYVKLRVEQSFASQLLSKLRTIGVVKTRRDMRHIYYSIDMNRIRHIESCTSALIED